MLDEDAIEIRAAAPSGPALRMRRHRERRRRGLRCLTIEIRATEIEALVQKGFLNHETRNSPRSVKEALYRHLERTLAPVL
jgi:hypothetical protein